MNGDTPRPSTVMAANGAALMVAGMTLLADWQAGSVRPWWWYGVLALIVFGALVALAHGGLGLLGFALLVWDAWSERRAAAPADTGATGGGDEDAEPDTPQPDPELDLRARAWAVALGRFFRAGDKAGFTIRALTPAVLSEDDWARLTGFYVSDDGRRVLRDRGGNQGTGWGYGWDLDGVIRALGAGALPLPGGEPPVVEVYVDHATQRNAPRRKAAVVENQTRPIGGGSTEVGQ